MNCETHICARKRNLVESYTNPPKGTMIADFVSHSGLNGSTSVNNVNIDYKGVSDHLLETLSTGIKNLNSDQAEQFNVFARPGEVGETDGGTHKIKLIDERPIKDAPRKIPPFKRHIIEEEIQKLEEKGLIEKSDSPWSSQFVWVMKKDVTWCVCVDYRKLNNKTVKDAYPLPMIQNNLDSLAGSKWFFMFGL